MDQPINKWSSYQCWNGTAKQKWTSQSTNGLATNVGMEQLNRNGPANHKWSSYQCWNGTAKQKWTSQSTNGLATNVGMEQLNRNGPANQQMV